MLIGAVTALGMAIVSVGATRGAAVVEQAPDNVEQLPLINRENPLLETNPPSGIVSSSGDTFSRNGGVHRCEILLSARFLFIDAAHSPLKMV